MMMRGALLRQLRLLEEADAAERDSHTPKQPFCDSTDVNYVMCDSSKFDDAGNDTILRLGDNRTVLIYESYLSHQRYHDDLKHVDVDLIDYGDILGTDGGGGRVVIEQRKRLGKGGFCWDAAFILGEHLIANECDWSRCFEINDHHGDDVPMCPKVIELGGGTGLTGIMVAKAVKCHVTITDLPELMDLMNANLKRNFPQTAISSNFYPHPNHHMEKSTSTDEATETEEKYESITEKSLIMYTDPEKYLETKTAKGQACAKILRWGNPTDYPHHDNSDINAIIGADVVASLYDPRALAYTFFSLSGPRTKVYVSYKERLSEPHRIFEEEMRHLFRKVRKVSPESRNKNESIFILEFGEKIV